MNKPRSREDSKDLREDGRIVLARGEQTGHCHEVLAADAVSLPEAQYFEEPDGTRMLLILQPCLLTHQEHGPVALSPERQEQVRQGDVLLQPMGPGAWRVVQQQEWAGPEVWRAVAD